jgi:release factor glutamine methyltransferase
LALLGARRRWPAVGDAHTLAALREALTSRLGDAELAVEVLSSLLQVGPAVVRERAHAGVESNDALRTRAHEVAARLEQGMPLAYATGTAAFRYLELMVDDRVLIPRPETEMVVEHALRVCADRPGGVAVDIGTGSGAIALSLASEGHFDRVIATDVSRDALDVARANADRVAGALRCPVEFRLGADLAPVAGERVRLLVSNPPYIAHDEADALPAAVRDWEPVTALFAADEGMARYAALVAAAPAVLEPGGWLVFECDARRAGRVAALFDAAAMWGEVGVECDLAGRERVCGGRYGARA